MGRILRLEQRSQAWFDWRNGLDLPDRAPRVMASEMPIIMGVSPFNTIHKLWLEKTGQIAPQMSNFIMEHGVKYEDAARLQYQQEYSEHVIPTCVEHEDHPEFGASLDGLNILGDVLTEVKCPLSERIHKIAVAGAVPNYYMPQVQWQLFVSGATIGHFYSWFQGNGSRVVVVPDPQMVALMVDAAWEFRRCVIERVAPAGNVFVGAAHTWRRAKRIVDSIKEALEEAQSTMSEHEASLISMLGNKTQLQGGGVTVTRFEKAGSVDQAKMARDLNIAPETIERYRKAGSVQHRVTESDKEPLPDKAPAANAVQQSGQKFVPVGELNF